MSGDMNGELVTGAFTLGGVALGAALEWARSGLAARNAAAGQRDRQVTALADACIRLQIECRMWRTLDKTSVKFRQLMYGVLESEAQNPVVGSDLATAGRQLMASAAVNGLRHMFPVNSADRARKEVLPLMSEVTVLAIRLSMTRDKGIKAASNSVGEAASGLLEHLADKDRDYSKQEAALQTAIGELRRARDAAAEPWWKRKSKAGKAKDV